jgi:hypothetical protein
MVTTRTRLVAAGMAAVFTVGLGGYTMLRRASLDREAAQSAAVVVPWTTAEIGAPATPADSTPPAPAAPAPAAAEPRATERPRAEPARRAPAPVTERPAAPVAPPPAPAPTVASSAPPPPPAPASSPAATQAPVTVPDLSPPPAQQVEAPKPAEPPRFEELTIKEDSVIGIRLETPVTTETAKVEDKVQARVTRDVMVDGRTAIPTGARLDGVVSQVETGGKFKGRSRIGIKFTQVVLNDNHRIPIQTETIFRDGDAPGGEATAKIGASAVVGAILGSVIGGKKGAAIGAGAGGAAGTAIVAKGGRNEAVIPAGAPLTVRLTAPVKVTIERTGPGDAR